MAFVVQDPDAPKADANAYLTVAEWKAYFDDRGITYTAGDTEIEYAIVRATDYIDSRWTFAGSREDADQSTECPRSGVYDPMTGLELYGYPEELKEACAEYSKSIIDGVTLYPTPNIDTTGRAVKMSRKKVAVLEKETEYFQGSQSSNKIPWISHPLGDGKMKKTRLLAPTRRTLGRG